MGGGKGETTRCKFMYKLEVVIQQILCHIVELGQDSLSLSLSQCSDECVCVYV